MLEQTDFSLFMALLLMNQLILKPLMFASAVICVALWKNCLSIFIKPHYSRLNDFSNVKLTYKNIQAKIVRLNSVNPLSRGITFVRYF